MKVIAKADSATYLCEVSHSELEKFFDQYYGKMKQLNVGEQVNLGQGYDFSARIEDACKKMSEAMRGFESARSVMTAFAVAIDCQGCGGQHMSNEQKLREALQVAEAALSDIGDADREPGDDLAWCERRAAQSLPRIRQALALPTAAPVCERDAFEREMRCEEEWGHRSLKKRQNGQYENWQVDLMWAVWQARAALGDWHLVEFLNQIPDSEIRRAMNLFLKGRP